ncbi:(Na+)-NQR maturation NqrM [Pseudomonadota bacterium]|nr:(Na+)-NQR maturation NqrM [Pseudomonadota bacterium]
MAISFGAIAVGVIIKNKPITGSCGGLANLEKGASCQICGRTSSEACDA